MLIFVADFGKEWSRLLSRVRNSSRHGAVLGEPLQQHTDGAVNCIVTTGFSMERLNATYVYADPPRPIGGKMTFWSANQAFIYFQLPNARWAVGIGESCYKLILEGERHDGFAYEREGIWHEWQ